MRSPAESQQPTRTASVTRRAAKPKPSLRLLRGEDIDVVSREPGGAEDAPARRARRRGPSCGCNQPSKRGVSCSAKRMKCQSTSEQKHEKDALLHQALGR
jgi:hypothetical protein